MSTGFPASDSPAPAKVRTTLARIWALLTPAEQRAALRLVALMVVAMVFEIIGVGVFVPAIALIASPDAARAGWAQPLVRMLGNSDQATLITAGLVALLLIFTLKALVLSLLAWRQSRFAYAVQARLSYQLLKTYLAQPYVFFLRRNSAQLIRNTLNGVDTFTEYGLTASERYVSELLILVGLSVVLLVIEPVAALLILPPLALVGWAFQRITRTRAQAWGTARQFHETLRLQHLQQALGGIKEIRLLGSENVFADRYHTDNTQVARAARNHHTILQLPRIVLELLAVIALVALALGLLALGRASTALLPTLALFSAAAFRLIPSVNRATLAHNDLRYGSASIATLHEEAHRLQAEPAARSARIPSMRLLSIEHVSYRYPGSVVPALHDVSLELRSGETIAVIGASGAGKSTLVDIVLGLLQPSSGDVLVDGAGIQTSLRGWQEQIGYVPQSIYLADDTIRSNVTFGRAVEHVDDEAVWSALRAARLDEFVRSLPAGLDTTTGEHGLRLSGGQRQRLGIARALYHNPIVLILDEATSSLDTTTEREVMSAIRELHGSRAILIVTHRTSTILHADRIYQLRDGALEEANVRGGVAVVAMPVESLS